MAGDARARMIEGAVRLLAQKGLQATSFSEVLDLTKAPRGSIYHHFPQGKDQMVAAAIELAGERTRLRLEEARGRSAVEVTTYFLGLWRALLTHTEFTTGCSVTAVTVASDSAELLAGASAVFHSWNTQLADLLVAGGLSPAAAKIFATTLIAACEGAVILSRAEKDIEPFDTVAGHMVELVGLLSAR